MEGWIKIHRKLQDWEWYTDSSMVHLFIHLLINANREDYNWKGTIIKRGQLMTGRGVLSKATGISERTIRTCLSRLEVTSEVTIKATNKYSVITICNYEFYQLQNDESDQQIDQQSDQQPTSNRPATDQQKTEKSTSKNKGVNSDKSKDYAGSDLDSDQQHFSPKKGKSTKSDHYTRSKEDSSSICNSNNDNISSSINTNAREKKNATPTWKTDFQIYLADVREAYLGLIRDPEFLVTQQKFHPNVDIRLTLEKACVNFWATEAGWKHKLRQRSKEINWKATLTNAISQPQNKVYNNESRNSTNPQGKTKREERAGMVAEIFERNGVGQGTDAGRYSGFIDAEEV